MTTENSKTSAPHRLKWDSTDRLNLKNPNKNMALANLSIYYTWRNIKSEYSNNKFKISAPTWNETFDLPDVVHILLKIFKITLNFSSKKHLPVQIYPTKIKNRNIFKIKTDYKLELLTPETMRLLEITKKDFDANKNGEIVRKLESIEVVLVHCNLVKNDYQYSSKV